MRKANRESAAGALELGLSIFCSNCFTVSSSAVAAAGRVGPISSDSAVRGTPFNVQSAFCSDPLLADFTMLFFAVLKYRNSTPRIAPSWIKAVDVPFFVCSNQAVERLDQCSLENIHRGCLSGAELAFNTHEEGKYLGFSINPHQELVGHAISMVKSPSGACTSSLFCPPACWPARI